MIPKIIHYIWLGDKKPLPVKKAIASWKKKLPDFKFKEWTENNIPSLDNEFYLNALAGHEYAFASDYLRLWILQKYGGIYLDSDMIVLRNLDNLILHRKFVIGMDAEQNHSISAGLIASEPNNQILKDALKIYEKVDFSDRKPNTIYLTALLHEKYGLKIRDENQFIDDKNIAVYSSKVLLQPSFHSYAIHVGLATWKENESKHDKIRIFFRQNIKCSFGAGVFSVFNGLGRRIL